MDNRTGIYEKAQRKYLTYKKAKKKGKIIREIGVLARKVLKQYQKNITNQTNC